MSIAETSLIAPSETHAKETLSWSWLVSLLPPLQFSRVLDFGCADGGLLQLMQKRNPYLSAVGL
jgi:2-polyprenyl-3-methyl-5-hydroxy-6-metoxy-1,4-benzoquinol methylase